jgi:hypothetical protein
MTKDNSAEVCTQNIFLYRIDNIHIIKLKFVGRVICI